MSLKSPVTVFGLPAYNGEKYLAEALESLLGQTERNLAIVVVDDCSTDRTGEIARRYAELDRRVSYERNERNLGLARNWRRAFDLAVQRFPRVPFFAWASDHDVWSPSWLEVLVDELDAHPEAALAYTRCVRMDDSGAEFPAREHLFDTRGVPSPRERLRSSIREMPAGDMMYGLIRRDALERCGPFPLVLLPDRLHLARLSLEGEFRVVPRRLWHRRYRAGVVMSNCRQRQAFFPEGVPLWAFVPWWLAHAFLFERSVNSKRLAAVVLVESIEQAFRRRRVRAKRRWRWWRREQRRRLRALLGRFSAQEGVPKEVLVAPNSGSTPRVVEIGDLERAEVLDRLDSPGAVVLEIGPRPSAVMSQLRKRFPHAVCLSSADPEQFPERVDLAISVGGLGALSEAEVEACIRKLHQLQTPTIFSVDHQTAILRSAVGRWYWLCDLWIGEPRSGRRPDLLAHPVENGFGRVRHVVGRRRLIP